MNSEWVLGSPERLIRVVLHGLEGPIHVGGRRYAPPEILPSMPAVDTLDNETLACVLTYVRRAWDHEADPVEPMDVHRVKQAHKDRSVPWMEAELNRTR